MRMPADCCVCNNISSFTPFEMHGLRITFAKYFFQFSDFRILAHSQFTLSVPPTWQRGSVQCSVKRRKHCTSQANVQNALDTRDIRGPVHGVYIARNKRTKYRAVLLIMIDYLKDSV